MKFVRILHILAGLFVAHFVGCAADVSPQRAPVVSSELPLVSGALADELDPILTRLASTGATLSACVIDADGNVLYQRASNSPMIPASNLKLLVTAAALDAFGETATFDTYFYIAGDELWLIGTGDPGFGDPVIAEARGEKSMSSFERWADDLLARGKTSVDKLRYWDGAFDHEIISDTWAPDDQLYWYGAPISGLNFNDNCIDIYADPSDRGKPAKLRVEPIGAELLIINKTISHPCEVFSPAVPALTREKDQWVVDGMVDESAKVGSVPVADPGRFTAETLQNYFLSRGIQVGGIEPIRAMPLQARDGVTPTMLAPARTRLTELLPRINKSSQNLLAEGLTKRLGKSWLESQGQRDAPGSWKSGEQAVRAFLESRAIDSTGLVMLDGSGLSNRDRTTARMICEVMRAMHQSPFRNTYIDSLSIAGVDGTLKDRLIGTDGKIVGKTGYIGGVRSLSVQVITRSGRTLFVSIIYNRIPISAGSVADVIEFEQLQDEAVRALLDQ